MKNSKPRHNALATEYNRRYNTVLIPVSGNLRKHICQLLHGQPRVDRISVRAKNVDRFLEKATAIADGKSKYAEPLEQIQDQIGARIIVFYQQDVAMTESRILRYFTAIENRDLVPESESEFGYFGRHLVLALPPDVVEAGMDLSLIPRFFELQIKTLFQHAWSEADHDLGYKPGKWVLSPEQKRLIAFTAAQAWGADHIFDRLFQERITPKEGAE